MLTDVYLNSTKIVNLSPLSKCSKLDKIDIRDNKICSLEPLFACTKLTWIDICNIYPSASFPLVVLNREIETILNNIPHCEIIRTYYNKPYYMSYDKFFAYGI